MGVHGIGSSSAHNVRRTMEAKTPSPKGDGTSPRPQKTGATQTQNEPEAITVAERSFFEKLFPEAAPEIRSYAAYQNNGLKKGTMVGTMIDRKG